MTEAEATSGAPARARRVAWVGTTLVAAYAVLAAVEILVLNPMAAVQDRSLGEIYGEVAVAGESLDAPLTIGIFAVGPLLALALLALIVRKPQIPAGAAAVAYLALLSGGGPALFLASFGAGMGLADTYGIAGGSYSPWSAVLLGVSALAIVGAVTVAILTATRYARLTSSLPVGTIA